MRYFGIFNKGDVLYLKKKMELDSVKMESYDQPR